MIRKPGSKIDKIILVGGGHSHVAVLADWARNGLPAKRAVLLTPHRFLRYSGMVPGWISGEHTRDEARVDLAALAKAAGAQLILDRCVTMDPDARFILTQSNGVLSFDIASIDTGGVGRAAKVLGNDPRLIDVRPIDEFVEAIHARFDEQAQGPLKIAVIGGGAAGFELAFALRNAKKLPQPPEITIFIGSQGPLPSLSVATARLVFEEFLRQRMCYIKGDASLASGSLTVWGYEYEPQDMIVAAIGSGAPDWPRASGLAVNDAGFIAVDAYQRSISHQNILASGDIAARTDCHVPHSGVHAVHTGPVLAANLRMLCGGQNPAKSYRPRSASLYLLSTGQGEAIASYGPLAVKGRWVSRLKAWIDKRWIARYAAISSQS